jgi:hypothetical protein
MYVSLGSNLFHALRTKQGQMNELPHKRTKKKNELSTILSMVCHKIFIRNEEGSQNHARSILENM